MKPRPPRLPIVYPGTHILSHAQHLDRCMISANKLTGRVSNFTVNDWIMDSGAFTRPESIASVLLAVDEVHRPRLAV